VELPALLVVLERLLENQRNRQKQLAGKSREERDVIDPFVGPSKVIAELKKQCEKVVSSETSILLQGETGTGKGVLANWVHSHGPRSEEAFVDLNCAGLSKEFLETELFGHEKGAFTGAATKKLGLLEVAHRGTAFLDEIGDMDLEVQPKLLKVLEEKKFRRLGDVRDRHVDVRLIAASHQDLRQLVQQKKFRSDLFYRISTIPISVPALRQRGEDIPVLAERFLTRFGAQLARGEVRLSPAALKQLQRYSWPGNIRELRNVLERAVLLSEGNALEPKDLRLDSLQASQTGIEEWGRLTLLELEKRQIRSILDEEGGHVEVAAKRLGIPRSTLYQKIKKYGIDVSRN
jgi:DNA-binding NtrC family response regulator